MLQTGRRPPLHRERDDGGGGEGLACRAGAAGRAASSSESRQCIATR